MSRAIRLPSALRVLVGGAVLTVAVRTVDAIWLRSTGRQPPADPSAPSDPKVADTDPTVVRDRLVYAMLLTFVTGMIGRLAPGSTRHDTKRRGTRAPRRRMLRDWTART